MDLNGHRPKNVGMVAVNYESFPFGQGQLV